MPINPEKKLRDLDHGGGEGPANDDGGYVTAIDVQHYDQFMRNVETPVLPKYIGNRPDAVLEMRLKLIREGELEATPDEIELIEAELRKRSEAKPSIE